MAAVLKAGLSVERVDCDSATGRVSVYPKANLTSVDEVKANVWDEVLEK
jgi:hypothetical protein